MSNIVLKTEFTTEQLELIKSTIAKNATDEELKLFLYRCKNMGLDPLKPGEVHFVKYGQNAGTMIVGIDGFRKRASKSGKISGIKRGVVRDDNGKLISAWCEVYRSDWMHPAREEVSFSEYSTGKNLWATKPETMLKKVAEVAALRMACPDETGGLYTEEEVGEGVNSRGSKAKELTEKVQSTTATPEFEAATYFEDSPEGPVEVGLGDFVFSVGKAHKGKKLKDVPVAKLNEFVDWASSQEDIHPDVAECKAAVVEYLVSIQE